MRLRRVLLLLWVAAASWHASVETIIHNPSLRAYVSGLRARLTGGPAIREHPTSNNNFEIFRASSRHLVDHQDLYSAYPAEHGDLFKYSPTFALLFIPFALMPWGLALALWSAINLVSLWQAVTRLLGEERSTVALAILSLEAFRANEVSQSNGLVVASILFAFMALERERQRRAAAWISLGTAVKIFPILAAAFAFPDREIRRQLRFFGVLAFAGAVAVALPLLVLGPAELIAQYRSWFYVETFDTRAHMASFMGLLWNLEWTRAIPNWPFQLAGLAVVMIPLLSHSARWSDRRFRLLSLSSLLLFMVLFNHQAEAWTYVIALTGIGIWYASDDRRWWHHLMVACALPSISSDRLLPARWSTAAFTYPNPNTAWFVVPCVCVWVTIQVELWQVLLEAEGKGRPAA